MARAFLIDGWCKLQDRSHKLYQVGMADNHSATLLTELSQRAMSLTEKSRGELVQGVI